MCVCIFVSMYVLVCGGDYIHITYTLHFVYFALHFVLSKD